jgi:hypothetical protein
MWFYYIRASHVTQVCESKLEELSAIWERLEELKEDERCGTCDDCCLRGLRSSLSLNVMQVGGYETLQAEVP